MTDFLSVAIFTVAVGAWLLVGLHRGRRRDQAERDSFKAWIARYTGGLGD